VLARTPPLALLPAPVAILPARRLIRPPDPKLDGETGLRIGRYASAQAVRILLHCLFRDASTAVDLTFGAGRFWKPPPPPGLTIVTNNIDPEAETDLHVDFTATGFPDDAYDVGIWDPSHLPHLAPTSFMARRYGTVRSTVGFQTMIEDGVREAWRISRVGILVKLADFPNGGAYLPLTSWAYQTLGAEVGYVMHTVGHPTPRPVGEVSRMPRNNGADWLVFRKDGNRYPDFVKLYERQEVSRLAALAAARRCPMCDIPIGGKRSVAATCSPRCRKRAERRRRLAAENGG
jgi:hypothetical protein